MPELPEVETTRRFFAPLLAGRTITRVEVLLPKVIHRPDPDTFVSQVSNVRIEALERRGKYLQMKLADGRTIVIHLRMTGRLHLAEEDAPALPYTHCILHLDKGQQLRYSDLRQFGGFCLINADEEDLFSGVHKLGLEPFDEGFDAEYLRKKMGKRRTPIKSALLDQSALAGLGNIYADEVLHLTNIHPQRLCTNITKKEWQALADHIPPLLEAAVAGNEVRMLPYLNGSNVRYSEDQPLNVYGHEKEPCHACGTTIERITLAGRSSYFCPQCQPKNRRKKPKTGV